jgi:hypothetical protein
MIEIRNTPIISTIKDIVETVRMELHLHGVPLLKDIKPTNNNIMVTCPVHKNGQEKTPSCGISVVEVIRPHKRIPVGTVNCFKCGYIAELPEFISYCFGHDDEGSFGFKWITSNFVNLSVEKRKPIDLNMSRNQSSESKEEFISEEELEKYRTYHPYMFERCLTEKVIDYFDVGYDEDKDCLTFPVHDKDGNSIFFQRRSIKGKQFLNDVTTLKAENLYGYHQVLKNLSWIKEVYITESPIDALTLWTFRKAAVATMQAIPTVSQIKLLQNLPIRKFISGLDDDEAGWEGEKRLKKSLSNTKLLYDIRFPKSHDNDAKMDINKMVQNGYDLNELSLVLL